MRYSLEDKQVKQTLDALHAEAKNDWKVMLKYAPRIIWGMMQGKSMMKALTPSMVITLPLQSKDYLARVSAKGSGFVTSVVNKDTAISCYVGKK